MHHRSERDRTAAKGPKAAPRTPGGYGRCKLNNVFLERVLCVSATTRNSRSVNKILDLADRLP